MSFFNALYTLGSGRCSQPIHTDSRVSIEIASKSRCEQVTHWAKRIVTFPLTMAHGCYNVYLMAKCKEIHEPVARQIYQGNQINYMPSIIPKGISFHIVSSPRVIHALTPYFRNDPHGVFEGDVIEKAFLPLLKDLFVGEKVTKEDFLFTCSHQHVAALRQPFIEFLGPEALPRLKTQLNDVIKEVLDWVSQKEVDRTIQISSRKLTELFTVAVLSRLFLNHPGTFKDFEEIGSAATFALNFQLIRRWSKATPSQITQYEKALCILRSAIGASKGSFPDGLRHSGLNEVQAKATLLLVYLAGSDTTSSALEYILWRLGQHRAHQNEIIESQSSSEDVSPKLDQFISECLRLYPPADLFSRYARQDLVIKVDNGKGRVWRYSILKGEGIQCSPYLAGRNRRIFSSPDSFQPHRFVDIQDKHPSKVFSEGAHGCPGRWFARAEMGGFLSELLKRYTVASSPSKKELSMKGFMTLKVENVGLQLLKREKSAHKYDLM